jgi:hypothetical protein
MFTLEPVVRFPEPAYAQGGTQTLACWYNRNGDSTGADSRDGVVGSIDRSGSGDYAAGYLISAYDGNSCPRRLPSSALRGVTTSLVRRDLSDCMNDNVKVASQSPGQIACTFSGSLD